jgi:hypothetical protein
LGRIGYVETSLGVKGEVPGEKEIAAISITPAGDPGSAAFVKVDATIHVESQKGDMEARFRLIRDGGADQSIEQRFRIQSYGGTATAITWAVALPSGIPETSVS